jgi:hypothetical protein
VPSTLVHALLRARLPQRAVIADIATQTICGVTVRTMLRALLIQTIRDIGRHGLELHVYYPSCYSTRRPANLGRWADRSFASARFRCSGTRYNGVPCRGIGMPVIRPSELLPVGGPVTLAFLWCNSCIWEVDQAHLDKPPWSGSRQRYRCPGCSGAVRWHIHGPAWRPFESRDSPWWP